MTTIAISKKLIKGEELMVVPRREYEEFSCWRETVKQFKEFIPTFAQKKDLKQAREEYRRGKYLSLHELKRKLAAKGKRKGT